MSNKLDNFIAEIKSRPGFITAAAADPIWSSHLAAIEFTLNEIDRRADSDPRIIEIFDSVVAIVADNSRPLKQRLLDICAPLARLRDIEGMRH